MSRQTIAGHLENVAAAMQIPVRMLSPTAGNVSKSDMQFVKNLFRVDPRKQRRHWHRLLNFYHRVNRDSKSCSDGTIVAARIIQESLTL